MTLALLILAAIALGIILGLIIAVWLDEREVERRWQRRRALIAIFERGVDAL